MTECLHVYVFTHVLGIANFADKHACSGLLREAEKFAKRNFIDVLQNEEFMHLTQRQLSRLISDDNLNVQCEERVFEAVLAWIKFDPDNRQVSFHGVGRDYFTSLLKVSKTFFCLSNSYLQIFFSNLFT